MPAPSLFGPAMASASHQRIPGMTRRHFRLDSATAKEVLVLQWRIANRLALSNRLRQLQRATQLLLHWWAIGHDPHRMIRCPRCDGAGTLDVARHRSISHVPCRPCHATGLRRCIAELPLDQSDW